MNSTNNKKGQELFLGKWPFLGKRMRGNLMDSLNQDKVLSAGLCNEAIILTFLWERKFQYFLGLQNAVCL